jgi:hypothetical protein
MWDNLNRLVSNPLFDPIGTLIIIILTFITLLLMIIKMLYSWYNTRPNLLIERVRITCDNCIVEKDNKYKIITFTFMFIIRNKSLISNALIQESFTLEDVHRVYKREYKREYHSNIGGRWIIERNTGPISFTIPNKPIEEKYTIIISVKDQQNKSYSKTTEVHIPKRFLENNI